MKLAVLGNGQLGAMLAQAGQRLGIAVDLLDPEQASSLPAAETTITCEREHWPANVFTNALQSLPGWRNGAAIAALANRRQQKQLLNQLGLATAAWLPVSATTTQAELHATLGPDVFLKRVSGGYDGQGQLRLRAAQHQTMPTWAEQAIAEAAVSFTTELSIIGARGADGQCVAYPLTENFHHQGVLHISLGNFKCWQAWQQQAESMLFQLMAELDYVGVMAIELFLVDGQLLINEIAPRVHNSGHWTQAGSSISQFELHLRAVCGLPLAMPQQTGHSVMLNLLGQEWNPAWLAQAGVQLHWYGKSWRAGRKLGHINLCHNDSAQLLTWLEALNMPEDLYGASMAWVRGRLGA